MKTIVRRLRSGVKRALVSARRRYYQARFPSSSPGTAEWLIGTESKYGGLATNVPRNKVSPKDPRSTEQLRTGGMIGGDRMLHHGYAWKYAEYLLPFVNAGTAVTLVEFGILKGTGLAIWCDLFPNGRIIGLDIDLDHTNGNMDNLTRLGAFGANRPELHELDQYVDNTENLGRILKGDRIDVTIDDGVHTSESILRTLKSVLPHVADRFVYIIEDNGRVHEEIRSAYPDLKVDSAGELTIVTRHRT